MRPIGIARRGSRVTVSIVVAVIRFLQPVSDWNLDIRVVLVTSEDHQTETMTFVT